MIILADDCVEEDEYLTLTLNTTDEDVLLDPGNANILIQNNDCKFVVIQGHNSDTLLLIMAYV